ncbi:iron-containing redox enzyme family protein [Burkholderia alba]|uniref:iron-containing redox enzyme family protein n=1 Tax=Burkholderia alba TaxID=2683677 RepID=UPI002B05423C|nr:iron-containing redox enzyme family protein [Burkholderia alba]
MMIETAVPNAVSRTPEPAAPSASPAEMLRRGGAGDQRRLNAFYLRELGAPAAYAAAPSLSEYAEIHAIEATWNAFEESRLDLSALPCDADGFARWYLDLHRRHRREVAPFFDYLAERASLEELAAYVGLEEQVDGRFDDVIALAQLGMSGDMKLALAENYWDEMGCGELGGLHTTLFAESIDALRGYLGADLTRAEAPDAALKNGNLLMMYALRRRHVPRLLGAIAILEHTAPYRFAKVVRGLRRFDLPEPAIHYHEMHIEVDARHGRQLLNRVLLPLVAAHPDVIREVCVGCLIRFNIACDYYRAIEASMRRVAEAAVAARAAAH